TVAAGQGASGGRPLAGALESADCSAIAGWTFDPEAREDWLPVRLYFDGPAEASPRFVTAKTLVHRPEINQQLSADGARGDHGFAGPTPDFLKDGKPHTVYAYGLDPTAAREIPRPARPQPRTCRAPG